MELKDKKDVTSHSLLVGVLASEVADLPRFRSFKDVELPLEHRSSRTNRYHTIVR
jgi:hypothetical protein